MQGDITDSKLGLDFEVLLAELATAFLNATPEGLDKEIAEAQRRVCAFLDVDLSAIHEPIPGSAFAFALTSLYKRADVALPPTVLNPYADFPWCQDELTAGRTVQVASMDQLPPEAARDRSSWDYFGIKSSLVLPLLFGGEELPRTISFDMVTRERDWSEQDVKRLRLVAQMMATALERKRSDRMLRESRTLLSTVVNSTVDQIWSVDAERFGLAWWNRSVADYFMDELGIRLEAGMAPHDLVRDEEAARQWITLYERALGGPFETDYQVSTGKRWLRLRLTPLVRDGRAVGISVFGRDVTESKTAEEALAKSEAKFRQAFMAVPDAFYLATLAEALVIEVNPGFASVYGFEREEVLGRTSKQLGLWVDYGQRKHMVDEMEARGVIHNYEVAARRKNGELFPALVSAAKLETDGEPLMVGLVRDISERVLAEAALRRSEEELRQAQKMEALGRLAGGIAHDFNNLLTLIIGYCDLVLGDPAVKDPRVREEVAEIRRAGDRASGLTKEILAFSRRSPLQPQVLSLNDAVAELEPLLRRTLGEDIELVIDREPGLWDVEVDPSQMMQVILNLVVNAKDAMPGGGRLTVATHNLTRPERNKPSTARLGSGRYAVLTVSDTGMGMTPDTVPRIFEPFFTTKAEGEGTGLGLSTVYGIVTQSGGDLSVESQPGEGTSFFIYMPAIT